MKLAVPIFVITSLGLFLGIALLDAKIRDQQCQIDQLCQLAFTLAREQGATDETGFTMGKEYCFFFADYDRNMAILGEFDHGISYDKKPRLIIMHNVNERNLEYWDKQPVLYNRFKKIPN